MLEFFFYLTQSVYDYFHPTLPILEKQFHVLYIFSVPGHYSLY